MKKPAIILSLLFAVTSSFGQRDKNSQLEDSIFTWKAIPKLKAAGYPRGFSPAQLKYPELFAQWLQKSYLPLGALDFSYAVAEPDKKDDIVPYASGLCAAMWRAMWDHTGSKVIRQPHSENRLYIVTNTIVDAEPIPLLTIPGRAVFTRRSPEIEKAFAGSSERRRQFVQQLQLEKHAQIGKYIVQYYGCDGDGCQPQVAVYIAPDNKLPVRRLTRGEVLDMCEQAITTEAEKRRERIRAENRTYGKEAQQKWLKKFDEETLPQWKANIQKLKDKYKQSLNMSAEIRNPNGIGMSNFETYNDIFDTENAERLKRNTYGLYTYQDDVLQKSKQDRPLWICVSWEPADIHSSPYVREKHRSMITHFNFDYVYDYFFRPESVKDKPYTILNEDVQKTHLASYKKQNDTRPAVAKNLAANVYFFEDFSGGSTGQKPMGWYMSDAGEPSIISPPKGETGNWLKIGKYGLTPEDINPLLPDDFKMEFDVATEKDFSTNTGGAFLLRIHNKIRTPNGDYKDAPNQIFIDLDIKAGNEKFTQNPTGYTRLKTTYTGMSSAVRNADVLTYNNDFSNRNSIAHIILTKEGKKVSAFIDGREIKALDKYGKPIEGFNELPEGTKLTSFYFENITNHSSKDIGIYITNIKITKL